MKRSEWQTIKQEQAQQRQEKRKNRTAREQLAILDARLGAGVGAQKERMRLEKAIAGEVR